MLIKSFIQVRQENYEINLFCLFIEIPIISSFFFEYLFLLSYPIRTVSNIKT